MLTVALFSHSRYLCGAERMLLNLALLLERAGTVRPVLLVPGEGELVCEARRLGLAQQIVPAPPWYLVPPGDISDYRRGVTECSEALQQILVDLNSDAVLINTMTNVPAMLAAVALDIPSLLWVHGVIDSLLLPGRSSEFAAPHDELLLHSATRVIALSNYTSDFCARMMRRGHLERIHNWTPVDPQFTRAAGQVPLAAIRLSEHLRFAQGLRHAAEGGGLAEGQANRFRTAPLRRRGDPQRDGKPGRCDEAARLRPLPGPDEQCPGGL